MARETARQWLIANGYDDVVGKMDRAEAIHKAKGSKERRSWWWVLAGRDDGTHRSVDRIEFPILREAQNRQNLKVTPNAIWINKRERAPASQPQKRWSKKVDSE